MKHNLKITAIILGMFLLTQFIGLLVQHADVFHIQQEKEKIREKLISDFEKNLEKNILKQLQLKFKKKK